MYKNFFYLLIFSQLQAEVFPIEFSISETKIVSEIPEKTRDFASIIPGHSETYIYDKEADYYRGYQQSYFAVTCRKGGWDCLRHYEILANGCIPYFVDLDKCDAQTMYFLPRELILEAMHLEGVSYLQIDHTKFDVARYHRILEQLLAYTKEHLTTKKMAEYLLRMVGYFPGKKVLFISYYGPEDYLNVLTLIGLKEALGDLVVDVPKIEPIYKGFPNGHKLYGKGMSYTQILEDLPIDRTAIEKRISQREFDLIIYGSIHQGVKNGLLFHDLVQRVYAPEKIVYLCGEDIHHCEYLTYIQSSPFFLREFQENH